MKSNSRQPSSLVCLNNQSGQAVIEYVLMVVVTISLMFMLKDVFTRTETFMYKYIGQYTACLMEYGELPSFNVADSDLKNHTGGNGGKVCNSKFDGFTIGNGFQASPSTSGSGSGSTTKTSSTSNSSSSGSSKNSSQSASTSSKTDSSDSSSSAGKNSGSSSPYTSGQVARASGGRNVSTADGPSSNGDDKVKVIDADDSQGGRKRGDMDFFTSSRSTGSRDRYKAITGAQAEEISKRAKISERMPSSKIVSVAEEEGRLGPRKSTIQPYERKPNFVGPQDDDGFTFGNFMKWLIIAAMFIAIFLFFGGQVMNFMNSQEK